MATTGMPSRQGLRLERRIPGPSRALAVRVYGPFGLEPDPPACSTSTAADGWWLARRLRRDMPTGRHRGPLRGRLGRLPSGPRAPVPRPLDDSHSRLPLGADPRPRELGIDGRRVGVMGDSAGGNRSSPRSPSTTRSAHCRYQALIYPATEASFSEGRRTSCSPGFGLTRTSTWSGTGPSTCRIAHLGPAHCVTVAGAVGRGWRRRWWPPPGSTRCATGSVASENEWSDAGVPVWSRCYDDMIHGFFGME